ncbi:histidine kinase [Paenibacillus sp. FSL W8-1187]|uniref:Two-component sensor histidine kinase n=1 Tax=Paenibacillus pasadenensis TaxID=217090 RepID=A0A2N5N4E5_9BACL|nr:MULTISPECIES: histidine kinase [Paenibacillus]PLT45182.1 two-component sensor histidine kinase [Paenibacillus pasadenensis]QGG55574.1 HAMP domain-containing protein [Paenibacillus sp. B01]
MKEAGGRLSRLGLFGKMFIIMVISTIAVGGMTSWVTVHVSQQLFLDTFSLTNAKVVSQIKRNFESFHYSILTASNEAMQNSTIRSFLTEEEGNSLSENKAYYAMVAQMTRIAAGLDQNEVGTIILGDGERSYFSDRSYWTKSAAALKRQELAAEQPQNASRLTYRLLLEQDGTAGEPILTASRKLISRTTGLPYGTMLFMLPERDFSRFYSTFTSTGNDVLVLDRDGMIVSSNLTGRIGSRDAALLAGAERIRAEGLDSISIGSGEGSQLMVSQHLPEYDFYIVNLVDKKLVRDMLPVTQIVLIGAAIVSAALLILLLISRRLTRSLRLLVRQMSSVTKRNFHNYMPVSGSYETRQLGTAFNYMLDELNAYIMQLVQTQREQRNAELAALQRQINPHFLYNTLASVNFLVQREDKQKATETIHALISLLQNSIGNVEETIPVEQEVQNLKDYAFINGIRYGSGIAVDYFISPDCLQAEVPKLILQPFMENAFFHAFKERESGYIYVIVAREGESLLCEIVDNGDGMDLQDGQDSLPDSQSNRQLFSGIGIRNVHARILLLYGKDYGVTIRSKPGEGTRVQVRLPFAEKSEG